MSSPDYSQDIEEIHKTQQLLIEALNKDQVHYPEDKTAKVDIIIDRARDYHGKLVNIKKSLLILNDKTANLKRRTIKILEAKEKADLELQRIKERQELLERHLEPVVKTKKNVK